MHFINGQQSPLPKKKNLFYEDALRLKKLTSGLSRTKNETHPSRVKENVHVFEDETISEFPRVFRISGIGLLIFANESVYLIPF